MPRRGRYDCLSTYVYVSSLFIGRKDANKVSTCSPSSTESVLLHASTPGLTSTLKTLSTFAGQTYHIMIKQHIMTCFQLLALACFTTYAVGFLSPVHVSRPSSAYPALCAGAKRGHISIANTLRRKSRCGGVSMAVDPKELRLRAAQLGSRLKVKNRSAPRSCYFKPLHTDWRQQPVSDVKRICQRGC